MEIITIETTSLGDRSYILVNAGVAGVVDPQRDSDRVEAVLHERDLRLTHVFETHVHNDYLSGGLGLARRAGAAYVLAARDDVAYRHTGAHDGDEFAVGDPVVRALHTPGHRPNHLSYVVSEDGLPVAISRAGRCCTDGGPHRRVDLDLGWQLRSQVPTPPSGSGIRGAS